MKLKMSNYEETVRQLDIYYGIGTFFVLLYFTFLIINKDSLTYFFIQVKRQLLRYQSSITGLFPVVSTEKEVASVRESIYCAAAIWSLYQAYRYFSFEENYCSC